jgi:hyperosmotically inducible periplasmic protein
MTKLGKVLAAMLLVFTMVGCQAMTGKTAGRNVDDASITASVKSKLATDKVSSLTRIDVDTNNGVVSLNGVVESSAQKARAQELASQISGVSKVVNNLQVQGARAS